MNENDNIFEEYGKLVRAAQNGDEAAFNEIYEKSRRLVYSTCYYLLNNNEEDAQDATQDTYLIVYKKLGSLTDETKFLSWLKRIATTRALDLYRSKHSNVSYDDCLEADEELRGDDNLDNLPDADLIRKDTCNTINKIIREALSDVQYQTVVMHYYDELPVEEIAQIMRCPVGTVKTRLQSSRIKIKAAIEEYDMKNKSDVRLAPGMALLALFSKEAESLKLPSNGMPSLEKNAHPLKKNLKNTKMKKFNIKNLLNIKNILTTKVGIATTAAVVTLITGVAAVLIIKNIESNKSDLTEDAESTGVSVETTEATTEATTETTSIEESAVYNPPISLSISEVPESEQFTRFITLWRGTNYDCNNVEDNLLSRLFRSESGCRFFLDTYGMRIANSVSDPYGLFNSDMCHSLSVSNITWLEQNILNMSEEDIARVNESIEGMPAEYDSCWGEYICDGIYYYAKGDAGSSLVTDILNIYFDGNLYYVETNTYDDYYGLEDNSADGTRSYYVVQLNNVDGVNYWSIIKCSGVPFNFASDSASNEGNEPSAEPSEVTAPSDVAAVIASTPDTGWKEAYLEKARSFSADDINYLSGNPEISFNLVFINSDDIPELAAIAKSPNGEYYIVLYSYVNGEVVEFETQFYEYTMSASYAPYANRINGGGYSGEMGFRSTSTFIEISDDLMTLVSFDITYTSYDLNLYSCSADAIAAGDNGEINSHCYYYDNFTGIRQEITSEEALQYWDFEDTRSFRDGSVSDIEFFSLMS